MQMGRQVEEAPVSAIAGWVKLQKGGYGDHSGEQPLSWTVCRLGMLGVIAGSDMGF
jgi:hypothetical protein